MAVDINDTPNRVRYTATAGQTAFSVPFQFLAASDLKLYQNGTLKTLSTHYTVTGAGASSGTVTLVSGAALSDDILIIRDLPVERIGDFPISGPFDVESLNRQLDAQTMMVRDMETRIDRRLLRQPVADLPETLSDIPTKAARANLYLGFDANGQPKTDLPNAAVIADYGARIGDLETISGGFSAVGAVADNIASVTAVAAIDDKVVIAADNVADINNFADVYQGGKASNPSLRNDGTALQTGDLYFNTSNDRMRVYEVGTGWIDYEATAQTAATTAASQAGIATTQAATATTQASTATAQATIATTQATAASTARTAAETARDAAFVNANVFASTAAGLAAVALNEQFQVVSGDQVVRYREDAGPVATEVARYLSAAGSQKVGGRNNRSFPRERAQFGIINHPSPSTMTANSASITAWGRFSIPAGVGEDYRAVPSSNFTFNQIGARVLFFLTVDAGSGTHSAPSMSLSSTTLGTQNLPMVEEIPGLWVLEQTIPASGYSAATLTLVSTDAVNPITGGLMHFCIAPANASGLSMQRDARSLENWVMDDYREAPGNLWPIEKATLPVTSGDTLEAMRVSGFTVAGGEEMLALVYAQAADGGPAIVDRLYMRANSQIPGTTLTENIFLEPVANHPGVYACWMKFTAALGPTSYLELNVDNAQASAFYTQQAIEVKAIQVYRRPPASFYTPSLLTYAASDGVVARNYNGLLDVYTPMNSLRGNEYMQWQSRRYDTTGNAAGGGIGSVLEDVFYCRRSGLLDFAPVYRLTDTGLNEFAMKKDDGTNENVGHNVHGGQARRASPVFEIDTGSGWVAKTADARADFVCQKVRWTEYSSVYDRLNGTTVIANLDTIKTWEGRTLKMAFSLTLLEEIDFLTCYMGMFSPYANIDNNATIGAQFFTITGFPSGAAYTPGGGVNATYPAQTRFVTTSAFGIGYDIEVKAPINTNFRSWVQSGSTSRKFYFSSVGQRDSFGIIAERVPLVVAAGTVITQEVWITASK
jgi:hypothetical protein